MYMSARVTTSLIEAKVRHIFMTLLNVESMPVLCEPLHRQEACTILIYKLSCAYLKHSFTDIIYLQSKYSFLSEQRKKQL